MSRRIFLNLAWLAAAILATGFSRHVLAQTPIPLGQDSQVNTYTTGNQRDSAIAIHADGDFVVVWDSQPTTENPADNIRAQLFDSDGSRLGSSFQVNDYTTHDQENPAVIVEPSGDFLVVWESESGSTESVEARRFSSSGTPLGDQVQITTVNTFLGDWRIHGGLGRAFHRFGR